MPSALWTRPCVVYSPASCGKALRHLMCWLEGCVSHGDTRLSVCSSSKTQWSRFLLLFERSRQRYQTTCIDLYSDFG